MLRNRTRTLSGRTRLRYKLLAVSAVLVVTVTCLVFIANSNTWTTVNAWMHTSQDNKEYENYKEERAPITADDGLFIDYLDDSEFTKETELNTEPIEDVIEEATADDIMNNTECGDGKIYYSNELYDCDGLLKDPKLDRRIKEQKEKEPPESDEKEDTVNETPEPDERNEDKILDGESGIHHILLHCGGNMPTAVDIFLDAYPDAELYDIYSFISDKSYSILYTKYKQHTTLNAKVSDKNETKKENIKTYGSAYESTQSVEYIDIAAWILTYINKSDEVVMILESEQEEDIAKHLVKTKAIGHIDKYYSIKLGNNSNHIDRIKKIFIKQNLTVNVWDNEARNFSDYDEVNRKHIPTPGMTISDCSQEDDSQKFLLILYSTEASVNALQVINFLQAFAHSGRLQTWIFLPYEMFKFSSAARLDMEALFHVFNVGMYISPGEDDAPSNVRNKAAFVNRIFEKQRAILEYILVERSTDRPVLNYLQDKENYKCLIGGVDITNLTSEVKKTGTMDIEETGKQSGDFLMINIDQTDSEYLVLFFIRNFTPWLLSVKECTV